MDSLVASAASVAGRYEVPRQLLEPMPRQLELVEEVIERERRLQRELAGQRVAPVEAVFDLLEQGGATLRRQAEALEAAGRGDEETAALMKSQAELVERTIGPLRQPAALAKVEMALEGRASAAAADPAADHGHRRRSTRAGAATSTPRPATDRQGRDHQHRRLPLASTSSLLPLWKPAADSSLLPSSSKGRSPGRLEVHCPSRAFAA
jgi:hypothetical protein